MLNQIDMVLLQQFTEDMNWIRSGSIYEQRVRDVERTSFTPLVMSTTGGMGKAASTFYKRFASMLNEKKIYFLRENLELDSLPFEFCFVESIHHVHKKGKIIYRRHPATEGTLGLIDLQLAEGRIF